ncbi:MAG: restriction endonuclease subunit S [Muribaculaceae bacterium]|nr:restriction endonuclease subunit S [Muribaculaceae bacterium]
MKNVCVKIPSLIVQKEIARILSALDDKIENNRKINENLEAQAQALFKSWFVDFEPFRDQPFVDSELGPIPQGWKVVGLSSIAEYINGLAMQKFRPLENEIGLPVLKIKELGNGDFDSNSEFCSPSLVDDKFIINNGDIIFSWSGTLMVKYWCGGKGGLNQHLFNVVPKEYPKWFVYQWTKFHLANFIRIAKDKAVTMGHIKRGELDKAKVAVPTRVLFDKINFTMVPIHEQMVLKEIEIRHLSKLRDTLLPKLMSGEIKV